MRYNKIVMDMERPKKAIFQSIRTKLIVFFCLLFVVVLVIIVLASLKGLPFTQHIGTQGQQRAEAFRSLNLVADLMKERLLHRIKDLREDVKVVSYSNTILNSVTLLRASIREFTAEKRKDTELWALVRKEKSYRNLLNYMKVFSAVHGVYHEVHIVDAETGKIIVSLNDTYLGVDVSRELYFIEGLSFRDAYITEIVQDSQDKSPVFHINHPIVDQEGKMIAMLVLNINPEEIIAPILHTGEGLGKRGEALLVNMDVRILTALKYPLPDGTRPRPLEYQIKSKPAVLAAHGEEGIIEAKDYQGQPVLAAYRHVRAASELGWGLIVKRDKDELFAPLRKSVSYSTYIGIAGISIVAVFIIFLARSLTRPLISLSSTAEKVAEGDLNARVSVTTLDEVGHVAVTFNSMIQSIQAWHEELEKQVNRRTVELSKTNEELKKQIAERIQTENTLRWEYKLNEMLASLSSTLISPTHDIKSIVDLVLRSAKDITKSEHGYVSAIDPVTKDNVGHTLTDMFGNKCQIGDQKIAFPISPDGTYSALWGYSLNTLTPFFSNSPNDHESSKGIPEGHIPLINFLSVPVTTEGKLLGQIALANASEDYSERDLEAVEQIGKLYAIVLQRQQAEKALRKSEKKYRRLVESLDRDYIIYSHDTQGIFTYLSPSITNVLGYSQDEFMGHYAEYMTDSPINKDVGRHTDAGLRGEKQLPYEAEFWHKDGSRIHLEVTEVPVFDNEGNVMGIEGIVHDITERKQAEEQIKISLKEKEILLQEIHHRVKNNMQVISSLLRLQASSVGDEKVSDALMECQGRVQAMAFVHETLYGSDTLAVIDIKTYIFKTASQIFQTYQTSMDRVKLEVDVKDIKLGIKQATPLGLIVTELTTNSIKYAFPENRSGEIVIHMREVEQDSIEFVFSDNGIGIPEGLDWRNTDSLGLQLVMILAEDQLDGTLSLDRGKGTNFTVRFRYEENQ